MRPQDEIGFALPRQDARGRRFLLRRLRNLPLAVDSAQVLGLVREVQKRDASLASALAEETIWERRELDVLRRAGGEDTQEAGSWTRFFGISADTPNRARSQEFRQASGRKLEPLLDDLAAAAAHGPEDALAAFRALGRIDSTKALDRVEALAAQLGRPALAMAAFGEAGGSEAGERALRLLAKHEGDKAFPSLLEAMAGLPGKLALQYLTAQIPKGGEVAEGVAAALEGFDRLEHLPVLDTLLRLSDPWVVMNAVETLGRLGSDQHLKRIEAVYDANPHPLVRIACLQAVGTMAGQALRSLAMKGLVSEDARVRAAAIEACVTGGLPYSEFRDKVVAQLNDPHPKLALNASLACVVLDAQRALTRVGAMLQSGKPAELLQAIHCLAYLPSPASLQALHNVVKQCPPGTMRLEGVKSLGRLTAHTPDAVPLLGRVLDTDDPKAREIAALFMAGAHPAARETAAQILARHLRNEVSTPAAVAMIESISLLGQAGRIAVPDLHYVLLIDPLQANAGARALATAFPGLKETKDLATHASGAVQAFAGLLAWYDGADGLDRIAAALQDPDPFTRRTGCEVARSAGVAAALLSDAKRLGGLAKGLGALPPDAEVPSVDAEFASSVSVPRRRIGLGVIPKAEVTEAHLAPVKLEVARPPPAPTEKERTEQIKQLDDAVMASSYYENEAKGALAPAAGPAVPSRIPELAIRAAWILGIGVMFAVLFQAGQWLRTLSGF